MDKPSVSVQIIVTSEGVDRVRLVGSSWEEQPQATDIYGRISHLVREIDRTLRKPEPLIH
jgi:hypothetical protein